LPISGLRASTLGARAKPRTWAICEFLVVFSKRMVALKTTRPG